MKNKKEISLPDSIEIDNSNISIKRNGYEYEIQVQPNGALIIYDISDNGKDLTIKPYHHNAIKINSQIS
jgi:hypothetical protein